MFVNRMPRFELLERRARAGEIVRDTLAAYEEPSLDDRVRAELAEYVSRRRSELGD